MLRGLGGEAPTVAGVPPNVPPPQNSNGSALVLAFMKYGSTFRCSRVRHAGLADGRGNPGGQRHPRRQIQRRRFRDHRQAFEAIER
jgi:hypothetical protein